MTTPRERQIEEFMRRLAAGEIDLENGRVTRRGVLKVADLASAHFRVALVSAAPGLTDATIDDIRGTVVASRTLPDPHIVNGALDAGDLTFPALSGGTVVGAVILADLHIIGYMPFPGPTTPNGGDLTVSWDNGPNRIMRL